MQNANDDELRFDPEEMSYANEQAEYLKVLLIELERLASSSSKDCTEKDLPLLEDAIHTVSVLPNALTDLLANENPGLRGDILELVSELMDAAFAIGSIGSTAETAQLRATSERQRHAGRASAATRQANANEWKSVCSRRALEIRTSRPSAVTDDIAETVRNELSESKIKHTPRMGAITDYIRQLEREAVIPKKKRA